MNKFNIYRLTNCSSCKGIEGVINVPADGSARNRSLPTIPSVPNPLNVWTWERGHMLTIDRAYAYALINSSNFRVHEHQEPMDVFVPSNQASIVREIRKPSPGCCFIHLCH